MLAIVACLSAPQLFLYFLVGVVDFKADATFIEFCRSDIESFCLPPDDVRQSYIYDAYGYGDADGEYRHAAGAANSGLQLGLGGRQGEWQYGDVHECLQTHQGKLSE